jgi:hypothetical protein
VIGRNPYEVLGVPRNAGAAAIRNAYRQLAKRWHPDRNPGNVGAEDHFKEIAAAYEILSNAERRAQFDRDNPVPASDAHKGERPQYSPDFGYVAEADWGAEFGYYVEKLRAARRRQKIKPNPWLIALAAWMALAFTNGMVRGYATQLDGVIESVERVRPSLMDAMLNFGPLDMLFIRYPSRNVPEYKIRGADGRVETFTAGPACSVLSSAGRRGSRLHKEAGRWTYELDGRVVSELPLIETPDRPRDTRGLEIVDCTVAGSMRAMAFLVVLALGLLWRPAWGWLDS